MSNGNALKKENRRAGVVFIVWQAGLMVLSVVVYLTLHCVFPARTTFPTGPQLVHLDVYGRSTTISAEDVDWYVGTTKGVPLLAQMNERNKNIQTRIGNLRQQLQDFSQEFPGQAVQPLMDAVDGGAFTNAARQTFDLYAGLTPASQASESGRLLTQMQETLLELAELKHDQEDSVNLLTPPKKLQLFWSTPWGILAEVVAWSLFGLFSSLLFHAARYCRRDTFKKSEVIVGVTKVFYTPVVAVVLILAVTVGIMNVGTVDSRTWMIPLFGFLAGFNSRKAATVVDGLSEWMLGRMAKSLQGGGDDSPPAGVKALTNAMPPPDTFDDLAAQAKAKADAMLAAQLNQLPNPS